MKKKMLMLKMKRLERGVTQQELCKAVGINMTAVSFYETGRRFPRLDILIKIANYLKCDLGELVEIQEVDEK